MWVKMISESIGLDNWFRELRQKISPVRVPIRRCIIDRQTGASPVVPFCGLRKWLATVKADPCH